MNYAHMIKRLTLIQIVAVIFAMAQYGSARAADLRFVRTGKHENFTRVVFEFQNKVQFKSPEITGKGQFSLVFLDASTNLPRQTVYKTGPLQLVHSVEFARKKSNLTASVRLAFPYFILKSYSLPGPDRIVVDAYWMSSPSEEPEQKESVAETSFSEGTPTTKNNESKNTPQNALVKDDPKEPTIPLSTQESAQKNTPGAQNTFSNKISNQMPEIKTGPSPSLKHNYTAQTYLLVALNVFTGCIVVLLFFFLFKRRHMIEFDHVVEIMDFIKKSDESIATIDAQIKSAFKKYDQF